MDHGAFDRIARLLGAAGSRRAVLGAVLGGGLAGAGGIVSARKPNRGGARKRQRRGAGRAVGAEAVVCEPPRPSANLRNCDYSDRNIETGPTLDDADLHSSNLTDATFARSSLIRANLQGTAATRADFRNANLCGANLSSAQLRRADFRGVNTGVTDLTLADLSSSGCKGIRTNDDTVLCGTTWCDGSIRNDSCPDGPASDFCCGGCGPFEICIEHQCVPFVLEE